ncbi:MAG: NAD(P)H-dependent glycerol-3-phosphate dehydrogenase [Verrucomicrobiales bacterium]
MKDTPPFSIATVVGAGSWGTALALALAERGLLVNLWCRNPRQAEEMSATRENSEYLPGAKLPDAIAVTSDLSGVTMAPLVLVVTPSAAADATAEALAGAGLSTGAVLVSCSKGIEAHTGRRMSEVMKQRLPEHPVAVLSGPNHAEEVAKRLATASVVGCEDQAVAEALQETFRLPWFRVYSSTDVAGIELGGAMKNVFAIGGGIAEGLGLGDNAKAALVTRGLAEMTRLGTAMGGRAETFQGLSGVGDLVVTCYSEHSRNHRLGRALGQGKTVAEALAAMGHMVVEGVPNTASIYEAARLSGVETPIIDAVHAVLHEGKDPAAALTELFGRQPKPEAD